MKRIFCLLVALAVLFSCSKDDSSSVTDPLANRTDQIVGTIKYDDGSPAAGIAVSDGTTVVATAADGSFELKKASNAKFIYYSLPADAKVPQDANGLPKIYRNISTSIKSYDFTLTRQEKESAFRVLMLGDIQVTKDAHITRFKNESVKDIKSFLSSKNSDMPTYAIHLGDITENEWDMIPTIAAEIASSKLSGLPVFNVIGNHDHEFPSDSEDKSRACRAKYEAMFGPCNYSFERGDVHFLVLDDIIHTAQASPQYDEGFDDEAYNFAKNDLALADKSKAVVLCIHAPMKNSFSNNKYFGGTHYYSEMLQLLSQFEKALIVCGHSHVVRNDYAYTVNGKSIREYECGAIHGACWTGNIGSDGAYNGYGVFEFDGAALTSQLQKSVCFPESMQMRIYRCADIPPFTYSATHSRDGYWTKEFKWGLTNPDNSAIFNIFNYRKGWSIDVYEDGVQTVSGYEWGDDVSVSRVGKRGLTDLWAKYWFYDVNKLTYSGYSGATNHMFWYKMVDPSSTNLRVVVHDEYGRTFENSFLSTLTSDRTCEVY